MSDWKRFLEAWAARVVERMRFTPWAEDITDEIRESACPGYQQLCRDYSFERAAVWALCFTVAGAERADECLRFCASRGIDPFDLNSLLTHMGTAWGRENRCAWGVAHNAGARSSRRMARWAHVKDVTGLGSTSAKQLCRDQGVDPDEEIGGE